MNCPKCGFVSFDHLDTCKNCGQNLLEHKSRLGIKSFKKKEAAAEEFAQNLDNPQEILTPKHNETTIEAESSSTRTGLPENDEFSLGNISFEDDPGDPEGDETSHIDISGIGDEEGDEENDSGSEDESWFEEVGEAFVRHEGESESGLPFEKMAGEELDSNLQGLEEDSLQMPLAFMERAELSGREEELELRDSLEDRPPLVDRTIFFKRGLAFGLDWSLLLLTLSLFPYLGLFILKSKALISAATMTMGTVTTNFPVPIIFLTLVISAAYFSFFHGTTGQTPGKMLFKLKVVGPDNKTVGMERAFLRWFGYVASAIPIMGGFMLAITDKKGQALHDKIAGTFVVEVKPQAPTEEEENELTSG